MHVNYIKVYLTRDGRRVNANEDLIDYQWGLKLNK